VTLAEQAGMQNVSAGEGVFDRLVSSLGEIDAGVERGGRAATELALGQTDNLHQVLIGAEQTRLQFELAMSMRNRVLEAYQEIMRMQV
jgi:flagellar hook-basal body complex protein FliE